MQESDHADHGVADKDSDSDSEAELEKQPDELYDDEADDKDEAWATKQRQGRQSSAILSCPCCLATLCLDCQQHELYHNQFRAMFVRNCKVLKNEVLRPDCGVAQQACAAEEYHPVHCATCNTHVGVRDSEEVYHFFNVVPTNA
jgi:E2F-associated phosphoprotein